MPENSSVEAVKKWLELYRDTEIKIDSECERFSALESRMYGVASPKLDGMPRSSSPTHDRMASMLAQKDELRGRIQSLIQSQTDRRHKIESYVDQLQSADERAAILMRYVDGEKWGDISEMLFGSNSDFDDRTESYLRRTTKIHCRALHNLAGIMEADRS